MRSTSPVAWLVPDLAFVAASVVLFYSLFLFPGYRKFFNDSDAGWHIRAGERIAAAGELPRKDPFSFSKPEASWFAWEWGADVIIGTIHKNWGLSGVAFFYAFTIAAGVWLWFRLNWLVGGNFLLACLFAAPMISTATLHWLARPHLLSWLFLLGAVLFAEKLRRDPRLTPGRIGGIAVCSCVWANVHGSFFLGPLIGIVYAAGIGLGNLLWEQAQRAWQPFAIAALISLVATFVNPYGFNLHVHVFGYLTDSELLDRVGEFQSFNFHAQGSFQILLTLGISAVGAVLAIGQKDLPVCFLSFILIAAALHSARGLPLVGLILLPLANGVLTRSLASWDGLRLPVASFLRYSQRLRAIDANCGGLVWAPVVAGVCLMLLHAPAVAANTGFPPSEFPVAAAAAIEALPAEARVLAPDKFGGYLIYRFDGRRKVFFDGRSDFYGAEFLKQCGRLMQARPGWQQIMAAYRFDDALLPNDYPLLPALEQAGWKPVYRDSLCTLLTRN